MDSSSITFAGLPVATAFFQVPPKILSISQATVMATVEPSRTSPETKPWWALRYAWDHCPVGRPNDAKVSVFQRFSLKILD